MKEEADRVATAEAEQAAAELIAQISALKLVEEEERKVQLESAVIVEKVFQSVGQPVVNNIDLLAAIPEEKELSAEDIEREMRMRATMYGDDVFDENGRPNGEDDDDDGPTIKKIGKKDEKLSNKARRKMAKEVEAKEREAEFNAIAMKRSIEGAQFAVSQSIVDPTDPQWLNALDIIIPRYVYRVFS